MNANLAPGSLALAAPRLQAHGALLAFDAARCVTHVSANLRDLLGPTAPALGDTLGPQHFGGNASVFAMLSAAAQASRAAVADLRAVVRLHGRLFEVRAHRSGADTIAEFEPHSRALRQLMRFQHDLPALAQRLQQAATVPELMAVAVHALRAYTGFERVFALRLRHSGTGGAQLLAQSHAEGLSGCAEEHLACERVAAQDPVALTASVHVIANTHAEPVALQALPGCATPLKLEHALLRSASDAYTGGLRRAGVGAALRLSVMQQGRCWGVLVCHHPTPRPVSQAERTLTMVLQEMLCARLLTHLSEKSAAHTLALGQLSARLLDRIQFTDQSGQVMRDEAADIAQAFHADAVLVSNQSSLHCHGDVPAPLRTALLRWLAAQGDGQAPVFATASLGAHAPALRDQLDGWAGVLAMRYDPPHHSALVLLRRAEPDPHRPAAPGVAVGPEGASQLDWPGAPPADEPESAPWHEIEVAAMHRLAADLNRMIAARTAEMSRHRAAVNAMLTSEKNRLPQHDGRQAEDRVDRLLRQVYVLSVLQQGPLTLSTAALDLSALLAERVKLVQQRRPDTAVFLGTPGSRDARTPVYAQGDAERLAQMFDALLDNAVRHGATGEAVVVRLSQDSAYALVEISNISPPIDPQVVKVLFSPTVPAATADSRSGLGFGLYVSQCIAQSHGGTLSYAHEDPFVTLTVRLPLAAR